MNFFISTSNYINQIARLHQCHINQGFISSLNLTLIRKLYQSIVESEDCFCIICEENNKVIGFIAATLSVNKLYVQFLRKNCFSLFPVLLPYLFQKHVIRKIFETLRYPFSIKSGLPKAELLSMVVEKNIEDRGFPHAFINC